MTIYISGKITGNPNYEKDFEEADRKLRLAGYVDIINPVVLAKYLEYEKVGSLWKFPSLSRKEYFKKDLNFLINDATAIYYLENSMDSEGSKLERAIAEALEIPEIKL
jgi:hypothetical protein